MSSFILLLIWSLSSSYCLCPLHSYFICTYSCDWYHYKTLIFWQKMRYFIKMPKSRNVLVGLIETWEILVFERKWNTFIKMPRSKDLPIELIEVWDWVCENIWVVKPPSPGSYYEALRLVWFIWWFHHHCITLHRTIYISSMY